MIFVNGIVKVRFCGKVVIQLRRWQFFVKFDFSKGKRETLESVYNLLKWTETFQNKNLKEIRSILDRYDDKVIWLSRKKDVEKIIKAV